MALLIGLIICTAAFVVEIRRAVSGHYLAWVYVFEWPIFAAFGLYVWWRLVHQPHEEPSVDEPAAPAPPPPTPPPAADDPELAAWQEYVARLEDKEKGRQDES